MYQRSSYSLWVVYTTRTSHFSSTLKTITITVLIQCLTIKIITFNSVLPLLLIDWIHTFYHPCEERSVKNFFLDRESYGKRQFHLSYSPLLIKSFGRTKGNPWFEWYLSVSRNGVPYVEWIFRTGLSRRDLIPLFYRIKMSRQSSRWPESVFQYGRLCRR